MAAAISVASDAPTLRVRVSPVKRSRSSTTPSAQPRPTTTIQGMPEQLGVLELHPGRCLTVIEQHLDAQPVQVGGQRNGAGASLRVLVGDHQVDVERRDRRRPAQAQLVVVLLGDDGDQSRHPETVGAHGQPHRFAVLAEHVGGEGVGVLAAELEDVADLDAARR